MDCLWSIDAGWIQYPHQRRSDDHLQRCTWQLRSPENTYKLFAAVFLAAISPIGSAIGSGSTLRPKLWNIAWFARTFDRKKIDQVHAYYAKYGFLTLVVGRFIPFGVRNGLFLTAGLGKMPFGKFIISDGIACLCSNTVLFTLAYTVGKNYETSPRLL